MGFKVMRLFYLRQFLSMFESRACFSNVWAQNVCMKALSKQDKCSRITLELILEAFISPKTELILVYEDQSRVKDKQFAPKLLSFVILSLNSFMPFPIKHFQRDWKSMFLSLPSHIIAIMWALIGCVFTHKNVTFLKINRKLRLLMYYLSCRLINLLLTD